MIDKATIENLAKQFVNDNDLFLVAVKVSSSNRITVLADSMKGITIDECAMLHRHIENGLDRETEDFELQVSSPGLEMPFCVIQQYYRNEGRKVAVVDDEGLNKKSTVGTISYMPAIFGCFVASEVIRGLYEKK